MTPPDWRQPIPKSYVWLSRFSGMGAVGSDMAMISWRSSSPITSFDIWRSGTSSSGESLRDPHTAHRLESRRIKAIDEGDAGSCCSANYTTSLRTRRLPPSSVSRSPMPDQAEVFLAGICAEHLIEGLRAAGLLVVRPVRWRLHQ